MSIPNAHVSSVDLPKEMVSVKLKRFSSIDRSYETNFVPNSSNVNLIEKPSQEVV